MANLFIQRTNLTNVMGRINYITSEEEQEFLEGWYSTMEMDQWKTLAKENQEAFERSAKKKTYIDKKTGEVKEKKCIEAKEFIGWVPNSWARDKDLKQEAEKMAKMWKKAYHTDCVVAFHWNEDHTNLHFHIIVSERERLSEPEITRATRNFYFDENGNRCKKADAVRTVHKGDITKTLHFLNTKSERIRSNEALEKEIKVFFAQYTGLNQFKRDGIHLGTQHVGNLGKKIKKKLEDLKNLEGPEAEKLKKELKQVEKLEKSIKTDNKNVRKWNENVDSTLEIIEDGSRERFKSDLRVILKDTKKNGLEWRKSLPEALERFENAYCMNIEDDWNEYLNLRAEIEHLEKHDLVQADWAVTSAERNLKDEQSKKTLLHPRRKEIKRAKEYLENSKNEAKGIRNKIKDLKNKLEAVIQRLKNTVPNFFYFAQVYQKQAYSSKYNDIKAAYKVDPNPFNIEKNIQKAKEEHENHIKSLLQQQKLERENQVTIHKGRGMGR